MKTRFLFWNLNRRPIAHLVRALLLDHEIDIVALAECNISPYDLLSIINGGVTERQFAITDTLSNHFVFLSALPTGSVTPKRDDRGISVRRIAPPLSDDILLVVLHLPSKLHLDRDEQLLLCTRIRQQIDDVEAEVGHRRTLVIGDLNMNPFETGMVAADGLHALADRRTVARASRVVNGQRRFFFYNPMWSLMGDASAGPPGTYYYNSGTQLNYYWNAFDQVLLRAELLDRYADGDVQVHVAAGATPLMHATGRPDSVTASDHLPLSIALSLVAEEFR